MNILQAGQTPSRCRMMHLLFSTHKIYIQISTPFSLNFSMLYWLD